MCWQEELDVLLLIGQVADMLVSALDVDRRVLVGYDAVLVASHDATLELVLVPARLRGLVDVQQRILVRLRVRLERRELLDVGAHHLLVELLLVRVVVVVPVEGLIARILLEARHELRAEVELVHRLGRV